ncbi:DUF3102 domain-containing protein [Azospirillum halopraeferens]|uniref:DUF3102 domain-containing protein n=1 Tax=Azospirillum halopraeferens TaxID=34010 RepID=UPI000423AB0F|nr:DUF3102 domain-containing protein [Azospirillum halopraeferens]
MKLVPATRGRASRDTRFDSIDTRLVDLSDADDFAAEIGRLWTESHERFVLIGQYLEQAKRKLPHGRFIAMIEERLPFGRAVAHKLMTAARAIESGLVPREIAPPSYSMVYEITTLNEAERTEAVATGIIRPDMRRAELVAFKRRRRAAPSPSGPDLEAERERLLAERARIDRRLEEIAALLGPTAGLPGANAGDDREP